MGIYDRDYVRETASPSHWSSGTGTVCKWLIGINVAVFILQILTYNPHRQEFIAESPDSQTVIYAFPKMGGLTDWFELSWHETVYKLQVWRVVTAAFCHSFHPGESLPMHLLFNMLFLWWFGRDLESMYGSREFLRFYLTAAVIASLCFLGLNLVLGRMNPMIGASGAVMAVTMVYAIFYPRRRILLFFLIPVEIRWIVVAYVVFDLYPVLQALGGMTTGGNVAHAAHLGGLAYGFAYQRFDLRWSRLFPGGFRIRMPKLTTSRRQIKIYKEPEPKPDRSDLNRRVDEILEKVSREGESSLSESERQTLIQAGQSYRKQQL